jgi:hypothetical protein
MSVLIKVQNAGKPPATSQRRGPVGSWVLGTKSTTKFCQPAQIRDKYAPITRHVPSLNLFTQLSRILRLDGSDSSTIGIIVNSR